MMISTISRDINADKYGDIIFDGGDVEVTSSQDEIALINASHRIMSGDGDMIKYPLYGANLRQFIGQPITDNLVASMKASISECLTEDFFLSGQNIAITDIREGGHSVYFKISVGTSSSFLSNRLSEINIVFSTVDGVRYV